MDNNLLLDAVERFLNDEMSREERSYFIELRKNNPEVDQLVVDHIFFLNSLQKHGDTKRFKHLLNSVQQDMEREKVIHLSQEKEGKLIQLWNRHKRTFAVAASIAGIVTVLFFSLMSAFTPVKNQNLTPLVQKINAQENKTRQIESKLNQLQATTQAIPVPAIEAKFRATGFIIDAQHNYIATNAHVVQEARNNLIVEDHLGKQYSAEAVYINIPADLAIIKITDTGFSKLSETPYTIKKTTTNLADEIFMLGYPKQEIVYGEGYISARNGFNMDTIFFQMNTSANEGSSGSPVINDRGELVGIVSSKQTNAAAVVYAIKTDNLLQAIDEVRKIEGNDNIQISTGGSFKSNNRVGQIRKLQEYVFMIKGN